MFTKYKKKCAQTKVQKVFTKMKKCVHTQKFKKSGYEILNSDYKKLKSGYKNLKSDFNKFCNTFCGNGAPY